MPKGVSTVVVTGTNGWMARPPFAGAAAGICCWNTKGALTCDLGRGYKGGRCAQEDATCNPESSQDSGTKDSVWREGRALSVLGSGLPQ